MNEERSQILRMLQEGKLTVEEAAQLLSALASHTRPDKTLDLDSASQPATALHQSQPGSWSFQNVLGCDIGDANFDGAQMQGARIWFCSLDGATLCEADLTNAWIVADNLNHTNLASANLAGMRVIGCNLDHADFAGADLSGALFIGANFDRGDFRGIDFHNRVLIGVNLSRQRRSMLATPVSIEE